MNARETSSIAPDGAELVAKGRSPRRIALTVLVVLTVCGGLPTWLVFAVREHARCETCGLYLKQIGLGLRSFNGSNGGLPPAYLRDEHGKPMHSWQSIVKPYLGYYSWRAQYSMKEPWNGPNNKQLGSYRDSPFQCSSMERDRGCASDYVAVVGPDTMWPGAERVRLPSLDADDQDTILLIEMPDSDYSSLEPRSPTVEEFLERVKSPDGKGIRCLHRKGLAYLTVGGEVRWFPPETDPKAIRRLLARDPRCEVVPLDKMMPGIENWEELSRAGK
jgi:hypothetical protein